MSQENVEIVRRSYSDMDRRDDEAAAAHFVEGVEWDTTARGSDGTIVYGVEDVVRVTRDWLDAWEDVSFELREARDAGDQVAAWMRQHARGKGSGITGDLDWFACWRFSDAKVIGYREYATWAEALADLGLAGQDVSQENVDIAKAFYSALAREDDEGLLDLLDATIEYVNPDGAIEPGVRRGIHEYFAVVEKMQEGWAYWRMYPERFVAVADQVAVVYRYKAQARSSGVRLEGHESARLTLRRGKVVRYEWFHAPEDALRAVGLEK